MRTREIARFEKILKEQREQILKNLDETVKDFKSLNNSDVKDEADQASITSDTLIDSAISLQQSKELKDIEEALSRMADKTYGICDMCTENIDMDRLKVKPHAKFCIDCREIYEQEQNQ